MLSGEEVMTHVSLSLGYEVVLHVDQLSWIHPCVQLVIIIFL